MGVENTIITFEGVAMTGIQLPKRLPYPEYTCRLKEWFMTEGALESGIRVIEPLGAHISYSDFEWAAGNLTAANLVTFENSFFAQRTPKTLVITVPGDSAQTFSVLFAADGYKPQPQDALVGYDENLYSVIFKVKILTKT